MPTIALLGGESSGKTHLAHALTAALTERGWPAVRVDEHLRDWCTQAGRAPRAEEQAGIAAEQTRRIDAARRPGVVVVADTTALVVAAYSAHYFNDDSLWPAALDAQRHVDCTLLMGLDLPWQADGLFRESPAVRDAIDARLRRALQDAGLAFQTIYGQGPRRLAAALAALQPHLGSALVPDDERLRHGTGRWQCEACSDPGCEHRLFSALLASRSTGLPTNEV